jgi:hypothetical protein
LFEDKETLPLKCVVQSLNILNAYPQVQEKYISHMQGEVAINKDIPWIFLMVHHRGTLLREVQEAYYTYLQITIFILKMELVKKLTTSMN